MEQRINWEGPFSWVSDQGITWIGHATVARGPGLYLWTVPDQSKYWINYVGISASSIGERQLSHLRSYLSGEYVIYVPKELAERRKQVAYDPKEGLEVFLERYLFLAKTIYEQLSVIRIFVAPMEGSKAMLETLESLIINSLKADNGEISAFLDNYRPSRRIDGKARIQHSCEYHLVGLCQGKRG
jgi:hypothetical protein